MRANNAFSRWTFDFSPRCKVTGQGRAAGPPELTSGASGAGPPAVTALPPSGAVRLLHWTGSQAGGCTWTHVDAARPASSSEGTRRGKRRRPGFAPRSRAPRTCIVDPRPSPSSPRRSGRPWSSRTPIGAPPQRKTEKRRAPAKPPAAPAIPASALPDS
ncbi:fibrosin-1-like protein [Cervus elaphus]|uniref:fibrosin-1-like protein n=1 Tax=Cervus elaphus TaxID=9860 RepID=UPI001CC28E7F|nr:fibrosin-1-like protein [Cervus elaphus]